MTTAQVGPDRDLQDDLISGRSTSSSRSKRPRSSPGCPESARLLAEATTSLAGGVVSNWQMAPAADGVDRPRRRARASGTPTVTSTSTCTTGSASMLVGHAHPAVVRAVQERITLGSHFAQPTADVIPVAQALAERFGLPIWRFGNSGTESTMDAIHLMRAVTGRERIIKVEGSYHGHHDAVQWSVYPGVDEMGPVRRPASIRTGPAIPQAIADAHGRRPVRRSRRARLGAQRTRRSRSRG